MGVRVTLLSGCDETAVTESASQPYATMGAYGQQALNGLKVLELAGLAPAPFCGLLLASFGASVLRIDRPSIHSPAQPTTDNLTSFKSSLVLDLKQENSTRLLRKLIEKADVLIDPFRPGVLEKLGLSPENVLLKLNPRLIVVRLTGFRRDGKYKDMAGHDINYLAVSGVLSLLGEKGQPPLAPGNILADFAGGGLVAFTGVLLALLSRGVTGRGQVVNANMADGVNFLGTYPRLALTTPMWNDPRGENVLDGGAPYYGCYECKDRGRWVSVGSLEPQFFAQLLRGLDLTAEDIVPQPGMKREDKRSWRHMRGVFEKRFKTKTRDEWEKTFDGTDACVVPVLTFEDLQQRKYDFRPIVGLSDSPGHKPVAEWEGKGLTPGEGGEKMLTEWLGWQRGREYSLNDQGAAVLVGKSKL